MNNTQSAMQRYQILRKQCEALDAVFEIETNEDFVGSPERRWEFLVKGFWTNEDIGEISLWIAGKCYVSLPGQIFKAGWFLLDAPLYLEREIKWRVISERNGTLFVKGLAYHQL